MLCKINLQLQLCILYIRKFCTRFVFDNPGHRMMPWQPKSYPRIEIKKNSPKIEEHMVYDYFLCCKPHCIKNKQLWAKAGFANKV